MSVPETLLKKYAEERKKRMRPGNTEQPVSFRDPELIDMDRDIFADHETLAGHGGQNLQDNEEVEVLIVGAGIHGLVTAHHLVTKGGVKSEKLVLVDKAGGFGGTWYWSRYPGVMCDVEGYCYLPLLEETGYTPTQKYPPGYEIREQCERVARQGNLRAQFGTTVTHQQWDESSKRWVVTMTQPHGPGGESRSLVVRSQFLICAGGIAPAPQIPRLNGVNIFRSSPGKQLIHTARWDWDYSGGSQEVPDMVNFKGKRVGIIGTGATAVQVLPHVSKWADQTYVFQRTPSYVGQHSQKTTTPEEWAEIAHKKGWQMDRMANLDACMTREPDAVDLVQDGWSQTTSLSALVGGGGDKRVEPGEEEAHERAMLEVDSPWTEKMRQRIDDVVKDPSTAEKLKPWYPGYCKRPTFHNNYLEQFNKPNVTLVDTNGVGVTAYTANGVMANDREYELDVLILATGYTAAILDPCPSTVINAPIVGRGQRTLKDKWDGGEFGTLFGVGTNGFPNLFFCSWAGSTVSANLTPVFETNARAIAHIVAEARRRATHQENMVVEVSKEAEDEYTAKVAERARWFAALPNCTPNAFLEDQLKAKSEEEELMKAKKSYWGGGILDYQRMVEAWKGAGKLDGIVVQG